MNGNILMSFHYLSKTVYCSALWCDYSFKRQHKSKY